VLHRTGGAWNKVTAAGVTDQQGASFHGVWGSDAAHLSFAGKQVGALYTSGTFASAPTPGNAIWVSPTGTPWIANGGLQRDLGYR